MTTPRSVILWQHRLSATARVIAVLACLLLAVPAGSAQPLPQRNPSLAVASSLGQFPNRPLGLLPDGVVRPGPSNYRLLATADKTRHSAIAYPEANPGDENWASGLFALPGTDYTVFAMGVGTNGHVYVGGDFMLAGTIVANHIAQWDGSTWSPLGSGVSGEFSVHIDALAVDAAGNLYVGGEFASAGGVSVNNIAKWDGVSWSALGGGMNGRVHAMAVDSAGNLYVGGEFTEAGGVSARYIAKWNGVAWSPLGSGMAGTSQPWVFALAIDGADNLYATGNFIIAGGIEVAYIAKWNGSSWSQLGSGIWACNSSCGLSLVVDASGDLYVGGGFTVAGGITANRIAKWDGTSWSPLGSGTNGKVEALAFDTRGNLYAAGEFTTAGGINAHSIAKWDGSTWSSLGSGADPSVGVLAVDADDNVYAGGYLHVAGGISVSYIAKWDGVAWSDLNGGLDGLVDALAIDGAGNLYAGGFFGSDRKDLTQYIARWDGSAWFPLGSGMGGFVHALTLDRAGNLYAGGGFTTAGNHVSAYMARWTAADGVRGVTTGSYTLYANNLPVTIDVVTPGTLYRLAVQRFNRSHPQATPELDTGYFWEIVASDAAGSPATGYIVDLTLSTTFAPDSRDQLCRYSGDTWDCAASAHTAQAITRAGISELSDWAVQNNTACADFDGDGTIDIDDLIAIANRWGQTSGTPGWDGRFDLRPDGRIDIVDIQLATAQWGQSCSF